MLALALILFASWPLSIALAFAVIDVLAWRRERREARRLHVVVLNDADPRLAAALDAEARRRPTARGLG